MRRCFWRSLPALGFHGCTRDKPSAGREKPCWFPAGTEKRSAVSALLSQPAFQSQARARNMHNCAGDPLRSLLDLSDLPCFQQPISSPFWSLGWLLAMLPMEKPLWSCSSLQTGLVKALSQCWVRALDEKANSWLAASTPS